MSFAKPDQKTVISRICQKRLNGDLKLLKKEPMENIEAYPDPDNMLIWYFLIRGEEWSDFKGGLYIGKVMHNPEYPLKPPDFMMLTPSGRFLINKKICLSNSSYHSNEWSSAWNIKAILTGFQSIMLSDTDNGISHIHESKERKQQLARESIAYNKANHPEIFEGFKRLTKSPEELEREKEEKAARKAAKKLAKKLKSVKNADIDQMKEESKFETKEPPTLTAC